MASLSLGTGLRALLGAQGALDTIGHNIANASTPGYSRQRAELTASHPAPKRGQWFGTGVEIQSIGRAADSILQGRILSQLSISSGLGVRLDNLSELESLFGELSGSGVGSRLSSLFSSFSALSADPGDSILRTDALQSADALAGRFRGLHGDLGSLQERLRLQLQNHVEAANGLAERVAVLNVAVLESEAGGASANDLRDQRDALIRELGELIDVTVVDGPGGTVRILTGGQHLVGVDSAFELELGDAPGGKLALQIGDGGLSVPAGGGRIGGLLELQDGFIGQLQGELDALAHNLILELNRVHSTGVPGSGPYSQLVGQNAVQDASEVGSLTDQLLSNAGLPFDVESGVLYVNVTDLADDSVRVSTVPIDAQQTSVGDFLTALNEIPGLGAQLDGQGRVLVSADVGFGFDFSPRLDPEPASSGTFGGAEASLGTGQAEPFALADGDTLDLLVPSGGAPVSIAFDAADFDNVQAASAEEVAAAINGDPAAQAAGLEAVVEGDRLFLRTSAQGSGASFDLTGGTALGALGWQALTLPHTVNGQDDAVAVAVDGPYTGAGNDVFTFVPSADGSIGETPGLTIEVMDGSGTVVATLDVGEDYIPGTALAVADGVTASFGLGAVSKTDGDAFALDVVADADTSDVLVALGLGSLLNGSSASDIAVRPDLMEDPELLATGYSSSDGDNAAVLALLELETQDVEGLGGAQLGEFYSSMAAGLGFEVATTTDTLEVSDALLESLETRREQVAGVNVDEELVQLLKFEQAFGAAVQFISTVNQLGDDLLGML